jgi:ABC-2 type transport system ATP-binding protein
MTHHDVMKTEDLDYAIDLRGLTRRFGDRVAVSDLDLRVRSGRVCGVVGPNGAGKTTMIRLVLGLLSPDAGEGTVLGEPFGEPARYLSRIGALIEGPAFYPSLTGRENLRVLARLAGLPASVCDAPLERVRLADRADDRYRAYSLGMKQRLGIAAALLTGPDLVILDEPANGLDPAGIREMRTLFTSLAQEGVSVMVSSHLLSEIAAVCDDVLVVSQGRMKYSGTLEGLESDHAAGIVARPEDPLHAEALVSLMRELGYEARADDGRVEIGAPEDAAGEVNRRAMDAGITLSHLEFRAADLEDAFFALTGAHHDDD